MSDTRVIEGKEVDRCNEKVIPMKLFEEMSDYTIKGPAYGKVPGEEIK